MAENVATEEGYKWWQGKVVCAICGHVQTSRIEIPVSSQEPIVSLECADCGNMSCQPE